MYCPPAFRENRKEVLFDAIRAHPLATLVTAGVSGLRANLIPFTLVDDHGPLLLRAHLARANDQIDDLRAGASTLVLFQGPKAYVSPGWYATKAEHGRVVPTWNYIVVQAAGTPRIVEDAGWLRKQIGMLTDRHETRRADPWRVEDAPDAFISAQMKGIVGLELQVERIEGKWKASQNQPEANRAGVAAGLDAEGHRAMAEAVTKRA